MGPIRFPRMGPTGSRRLSLVENRLRSPALYRSSVDYEREGAMSRRTFTVDWYKEIERLLAVGRGIREYIQRLDNFRRAAAQ